MRKEILVRQGYGGRDGLDGDLDRLPMLTWIMFLKFFGDLGLQLDGEARLAGKTLKAGAGERALRGEL